MQKNRQRGNASLKKKKKFTHGIVYIKATFNNTLITITDWQGNVASWSSAGACGFRGAKKATPFAAQTAVRAALQPCIEGGLRFVEVVVCGPGSIEQAHKIDEYVSFDQLKKCLSLLIQIGDFAQN